MFSYDLRCSRGSRERQVRNDRCSRGMRVGPGAALAQLTARISFRPHQSILQHEEPRGTMRMQCSILPRSTGAPAPPAAHSSSSPRARPARKRAPTPPSAKAADTTAAAAATPAMFASAGATDSMKTPESVRYDADLDAYFVSNINGNPSQKDGNGFIARVDAGNTSPMTIARAGRKERRDAQRAEGARDRRRHTLGRGHRRRTRVQQANRCADRERSISDR